MLCINVVQNICKLMLRQFITLTFPYASAPQGICTNAHTRLQIVASVVCCEQVTGGMGGIALSYQVHVMHILQSVQIKVNLGPMLIFVRDI